MAHNQASRRMQEIPQSIGPYRILSKVGEGGMGVVYKAEDQRLSRIVALKVIREFPSSDNNSRRQRFWQEARAAAQVAHPNACRIYDIAEDGDQLVLVMEFIEGDSLAFRILQGALPPREAAQIVLAVLSALEAFHKLGIVHRDLKPGNVLLSGAGTKLLDFGIAKQMPLTPLPETSATVLDTTLPGSFLGTPKYASPEQFRGLQVDARSDLFSVGVIFFEMLTGNRPFPGESFGDLAHSVLYGTPPALTGSPAISAMGRIVHRALARDPRDRYSSAESMAADIRAALLMEGLDTAARAHALRRLIVLPFRVLRPHQETEFLAYSLPEAITVSLAGLQELVVRSSLVASQYPVETLDLQKIAREAEVDIVLTGTLLTVGERIRITAQLTEVPSGTLLWSHSAQTTARELLQLHDDLVRRVVDSILPSISPQEHHSLQQDRPESPTVYQLYLQANEFSRKWESLPTAIELYERCLRIEESYAPAWARLGRARWLLDKYSRGSQEGMLSAGEAFQTSLQLNPDLTLAHNLYTALQLDQGQPFQAMRRLLDRAQKRRSDPELFAGLGHVCRYCGLLQAALAAQHEARRLDPRISISINHTYSMLGDHQSALESSGRDFGYAVGFALAKLGRIPEAIATLRERELSNPPRLGKLYLTSLRALLERNREECIAAVDELLQTTFRDPEGMYYQCVQLAFLDEKSRAIEMLRRSVDNGFYCYSAMVSDPWLDSLRGLPEFNAILRKAHDQNLEAYKVFLAGGGDTLLGIRPDAR
jgi:TolB-like protein/tRNA A-37 threonylcarbamoyl transferase component Bud32/tetratricopeptide (TPR) repeat protein